MNQRDSLLALKALLVATRRSDVFSILDRLYSLDGGKAVTWRPLGDREGNFATVHLTANPEVSLVERITNGIDATFERLAEETPELKTIRSPREFSEKALGFKGGVIADSIKRRKKEVAMESGVDVTLWDGDAPESPTIDVSDDGIGLTRKEIPETILSLNQSNKITKWYLMGRFGQGGSTTFAFTDFSILVSRKFTGSNEVSFTVVKFQPPAHDEKDGKYVYLVDAQDNLPLSVRVEDKKLLDSLSFNTLVRHVNYRIGKQNLLSLYGKLQYYLFDPVLPFKLVNQQVGAYQERLRRIYGSRDRLNRSDFVEHKSEIQVPAGEIDYGTIVIRYWLFKRRTDSAQKMTFVDPDHPIVVTYYGQSHSVLPRRFLNECQLPYLQRDLVVQIDCDMVNDVGRRALFPSTRESITSQGSSILKKIIVEILSNSRELKELNRQREEEFLSEGFTKEKDEMRRNLAEMINRILPGRLTLHGGNRGEGDKKPASPESLFEPSFEQEIEEAFVPSKDFPTFIKIMNKANPLLFRPNQSVRIEILSDAPNDFLASNQAYFSLGDEADRYLTISYFQKDFHYGRIFVATRVKEKAPIFTKFNFEIRLNALDSSAQKVILKDERPALIEEPLLKKEKPSNIQTDAPYIEVVDRNHQYYQSNNWTEHDVAEVEKTTEKTVIYVSIENEWYIGALRRSKYAESMKRVIQNRYVLLIAFHAFLQDDFIEKLPSDSDKQQFEKLKQDQLEIGARTILTGLTTEKAFEMVLNE
jgi:hypothetical protein